jgi:hypothetical protein
VDALSLIVLPFMPLVLKLAASPPDAELPPAVAPADEPVLYARATLTLCKHRHQQCCGLRALSRW